MKCRQQNAIIIIPDVHGCSFWREPSEKYRQSYFVFLGDFLDPYPEDNILEEDAFQGLMDIVAFKKAYPDRVTLLWGNHDLHYFSKHFSRGSRYDKENEERNRLFFEHNKDCFQIAVERSVNGRRYLFTHAGVGRMWIKNYAHLKDEDFTADWFNKCLSSSDFWGALNQISKKRGGTDLFGSMVWADAREQLATVNVMMDITQIFGHTFLGTPMNIQDRIYCLDCGRPFFLNMNDGLVYDLTTGELVGESI